MSTTTATLQDVASVDEFLNVAAIETVPLFEHLSFDFLLDYDVFAPSNRGRTRIHQPPDLFCGFLHCYYEDVYGTRPVTRELQNGLVWYYCGLDKPPSRDTIDRFLTDLEHVIDDVFTQLVEQAAVRGLLDVTYSIDSTHVEAIQYNDAASWNYNPTAEEYYYGFGCTIVSTGSKIPIAAEFTQTKQADKETAMRVTSDALAVRHQCGCWATVLTISLTGTTTCWPQGSCRLRRIIHAIRTIHWTLSTELKTKSRKIARTCS